MGDRVIVIVTNADRSEVSPVIYGHWSAESMPNYLSMLKELMKGREGDVYYTAARLIGIMHEDIDGNLSLGVWNMPDEWRAELCTNDEEIISAWAEENTYGDGGIILYNCDNHSWKAYAGYLTETHVAGGN